MNDAQRDFVIQNTKVILPPKAVLNLHGGLIYNVHLLTEEMDSCQRFIREVELELERPQIVHDEEFNFGYLDGFDEHSIEYLNSLPKSRLLKIPTYFRKRKQSVFNFSGSTEEAIHKIEERVRFRDNPCDAFLTSVEEGWQVGLIYFALTSLSNAQFGP
jgi:hypothetical protein